MAEEQTDGSGGAGDQHTSRIQGSLTLHGTLELSPPHQPIGATSHSQDDAKSYKTAFDRVLSRVGAIFAILFGGALVVIGFLQWRIYSQQADIMRLDQRAWVYPSKFEVVDPLTFANGVAKTTFKLTLKNPGRLPARRVFTPMYLFPVGINTPQPVYNKDQRIVVCRKGVKARGITEPFGAVVFAGQEITDTQTVGTDGIYGPFPRPQVAQDTPTALALTGCIRYQSGNDPSGRCTGIWALLSSNGPDGLGFLSSKSYPAASLALGQSIVGQFVDDCD